MPWKARKGKSYFYESVRRGGRVGLRYRGGGDLGAAFALMAALDRRDRAGRRDAWRQSRDAFLAEEREADEAFARVERAFRSAMGALGYHRPARGPWRRRRRMADATTGAPAGDTATAVRLTAAGIAAEMRLAEAGDAAAMKRVRARFADGGKGSELAGLLGSPEYYAEEATLKVFAGTNPVG